MKHLEEQGLTYTQHYFRVMKMTFWCFKMYFVCTIHAVFPFWFMDTFSKEVKRIANRFEEEENARRR